MTGIVYLIGAGPGDPGLLTTRGRACLAVADAVVFDRLVSPRLLTLTQAHTELYYVGKEAGAHTLPQQEISALLVRLAQAGKSVVRLKGGDPFVFGRGGEEAMLLREHSITWEVVPGVSSAVAVPAYAGIPVTHRQIAPQFTVLAGQLCMSDQTQQGGLAVGALGTIVVLMGVSQLPQIVAALRYAGRSEQTPVALVRWGTSAAQATLTATLATVVQLASEQSFAAPAVFVAGDVVGLQKALAWLPARPLTARRVLIAAECADTVAELTGELEGLGAEVVALPVASFTQSWGERIEHFLTELCALSPTDRKDAKVSDVNRGLYFHTALGAQTFMERVRALSIDLRTLATISIGAVDAAVARTLAGYGLYADLVEKLPVVHKSLARADEARRVHWLQEKTWTAAEEGAWFDEQKLLTVVRAWAEYGDGWPISAIWVDSPLAWRLVQRALTADAAGKGEPLLRRVGNAQLQVFAGTADVRQAMRKAGLPVTALTTSADQLIPQLLQERLPLCDAASV